MFLNYYFHPGMGIYENDIAQGVKNIDMVTSLLKIPMRTTICSKVIFHHVYPTLCKNHSLTDISFISLYLSTKIEETHLKLENLISAINTIKDIKLNRQTFILCEANIIQALDYNFEIEHIHLFIISISNYLNVEVDLQNVYKIFDSSKVNKINFFGKGIYDPKMVALAFFDDVNLRKIEIEFFVDIDQQKIKEIRDVIYGTECPFQLKA